MFQYNTNLEVFCEIIWFTLVVVDNTAVVRKILAARNDESLKGLWGGRIQIFHQCFVLTGLL